MFNPLDPLGIFEPVKRDIDTMARGLGLPPPPGPPGLGRRTEEERTARHAAAYGGSPPERGTGFQKLFDPLGLFGRSKGSIGNPIPIEFNSGLVDLKAEARSRLIERGYPGPLVDKALNWYEEWLMGMARRLAPGDIDLQKRVVQSAYAEIAPRAEQWIRGIQEAFGVAAPVR